MKAAFLYEWRRAVTLRSTWWIAGSALVTSLFFTWVAFKIETGVSGVSDGPLALAKQTSFAVVVNSMQGPYQIVTTIIAAFAAMAWGHEYRYGLTRVTFSAFPRRGEIFLAKTSVILIVTALIWLMMTMSSVGLLKLIDSKQRISFNFFEKLTGTDVMAAEDSGRLLNYSSVAFEMLLRTLAYVLILVLLVAAISAITRSLPLALVLSSVWPLFVEKLLLALSQALGKGRLGWLNDVAPFDNAERFVLWRAGYDLPAGNSAAGSLEHLITPWRAGYVFAAWALLLTAIAYLLVERRDA